MLFNRLAKKKKKRLCKHRCPSTERTSLQSGVEEVCIIFCLFVSLLFARARGEEGIRDETSSPPESLPPLSLSHTPRSFCPIRTEEEVGSKIEPNEALGRRC